MTKFDFPEDVKFETLSPSAPTIKVSVLKCGALKVSFSKSAHEKLLGSAKAVAVRGLSLVKGGDFLEIVAGSSSASMFDLHAPRGRGGFFVIHSHPFEPGVIHGAVECEFEKRETGAVVRMPDWQAMAAGLEEEDGEDDQQ